REPPAGRLRLRRDAYRRRGAPDGPAARVADRSNERDGVVSAINRTAACFDGAAVVRAGAAVVPRSPGARKRGVHRAAGAAHRGARRGGVAAPRAPLGGGATRDAP